MPEEKNQLEELEEGIEKIEEKMGLNETAEIADLSDSLVNQMKAARMSIQPMFTFHLGTEVKTRSNEIGYIEMCAIDFRGEIYLVHFKSDNSSWYTATELTRVDALPPYAQDPIPSESLPKTDFPEELKE